MASFDDSADPALGAACNRLAAYCEALPAGASVDEASGLSEPDLVLILRHLHTHRHDAHIEMLTMEEAGKRYGRSSIPLTKR